MNRIYAVRGATTLESDTREEVILKTQELLRELIDRNTLRTEDLVSIIFTATDDIRAEFPAAAARLMELGQIPLLCARELASDSSLAVDRCVRVMIHCYSENSPVPVYLHDAAGLLSPPEPA